MYNIFMGASILYCLYYGMNKTAIYCVCVIMFYGFMDVLGNYITPEQAESAGRWTRELFLGKGK